MVNTIQVENIKCGGCANSIRKELARLHGISEIEIDVANGAISFESEDDFQSNALVSKLTKMGYPPLGDGSIIASAKSYVSCMIGRVSK